MPQALVISNDRRPEAPLIAALRASGVRYTAAPGSAIPPDPKALMTYSAVVIDNVPASDLPAGAMPVLERYVKDLGGGFLMLGGKKSFAAGGYVGTPIERVLPVEMPTRSVTGGAATVVLLMDTSGSMQGPPLTATKEAAKYLLRLMKGHTVAVTQFSDFVGEVFPLTPITDDLATLDARIDAIQITGGTMFGPPLASALQILKGMPGNRFAILLTDGMPADAPNAMFLTDELARAGVQVSTVGIGHGVNEQLLQAIASQGNGRFHRPDSLERLQDVFREEAKKIVVGTPVVEEVTRVTIPHPHPAVRGFKSEDFPGLSGFMGTVAKDRAQVALAGPNGDPILATARYGLGLAGAFMADTAGEWTKDWIPWARFPQFMGQAVKAVFRSNDSDFSVKARIESGEGRIVVDAVDRGGAYINFVPLLAQVTTPGVVTPMTVDLAQRGPGRYEASFIPTRPGFYRVDVFRKTKRQEGRVGVTGAVMAASIECEPRSVDRATLDRIASATGGRVGSPRELGSWLAEVPAREELATTDRWPGLLVLALVVFFIEVVLRRTGAFKDTTAAADAGAAQYVNVAESYLRMAREMETRGEHSRAQECYLKAHSYYLKARRENDARSIWQRYRQAERRAQ